MIRNPPLVRGPRGTGFDTTVRSQLGDSPAREIGNPEIPVLWPRTAADEDGSCASRREVELPVQMRAVNDTQVFTLSPPPRHLSHGGRTGTENDDACA